MKQYCRYCGYCFVIGDDLYACSAYPGEKEIIQTRKQINRVNHCPNFALTDLGDVETGKEYKERDTYKKKRKTSGTQISMFDEVIK